MISVEEIENPNENTSSEVNLLEIEINPEYVEQKVKIGAHLPVEEREGLISFPKENTLNFAWITSDMLDIDTFIVDHKLNIRPYLHSSQTKG